MTSRTTKTILIALFCIFAAFATACASTGGTPVAEPGGMAQVATPIDGPAALDETAPEVLTPEVPSSGDKCFADPACDPAFPR